MSTKQNKTQLSQKQRLAVLLMASGTTQKEAADLVGVDKQTISRWKKLAAFKNHLDKKAAEVEAEVEQARDVLIEGAFLAALRMLYSLDSGDEAVALRAAGGILDRVGISKIQKLEHTGSEGGPIEIDHVDEARNKLLAAIEKEMEGPDASTETEAGSGSE
jgi:transcriptional regulator with XRE-family HTH domain